MLIDTAFPPVSFGGATEVRDRFVEYGRDQFPRALNRDLREQREHFARLMKALAVVPQRANPEGSRHHSQNATLLSVCAYLSGLAFLLRIVISRKRRTVQRFVTAMPTIWQAALNNGGDLQAAFVPLHALLRSAVWDPDDGEADAIEYLQHYSEEEEVIWPYPGFCKRRVARGRCGIRGAWRSTSRRQSQTSRETQSPCGTPDGVEKELAEF